MNMFLVKAFLMGVLPFYRVSFPLDLIPNKMEYIEYKQGHELGKAFVQKGQNAYTQLYALLKKEKQDWRYDMTTYAPEYLYSSPKFRINCFDGALIVNYQDEKNDWVQISKKIDGMSCPVVQTSNSPAVGTIPKSPEK